MTTKGELTYACLDTERLKHTVAAASVIGLLAVAAPAAADDAYRLVEPGVPTVAITGDMPGLVARDGKLTGYDGDIPARSPPTSSG